MVLMYKRVIKPILFLFSPDFVHNTIVRKGRLVQAVSPVRWTLRKMWHYEDERLKQDVLGIKFNNPIGLSAGFDKNIELAPLMESIGFGFETGGSVTLSERKGNVRPWFFRLPKTGSIVVHAGLANKGMIEISKSIRRNKGRVKNMRQVISVAVVAKTSKETNQDAIIDAKNTIRYILKRDLAEMIEINISCPNVGHEQPFSQPELLHELLTEIDKIDRTVPFFVKMPNLRNLTHFDKLLKVVTRHNIQGVTVANLVKDRENVKLKDDLPEDIEGGLSGMPTRKRSTELVRHTYKYYGDKLVIIGVGGVFTAEHAYEKIKAGASLVGLITGLIFEGPQVVGKMNKQLLELMAKDGFANISEAIGADHKKS